MQAVRLRVIPEEGGVLHFSRLPVIPGRPVEVIIRSDELSSECRQSLAALQNDASYAFLTDPAEDLYTLDDLKERYD